jgi:imidazolonepropionase-like amidohydrolase
VIRKRPLWALVATLGLTVISLALFSGGDAAQNGDGTVAYRGARIYTAAGPVIEKGVLLVRGGKIVAVGPEETTPVPQGAAIRDLSGKTIIPGLVDTHSHIGIFGRPAVGVNGDGNEMTGPVQPGLRAIDAINPDDPGIRMALAGGVTTANIMPGSGNAIGGQTLYVKLRGAVIEAMQVLTGLVLGGIKFANGENPKGVYSKKGLAPSTRMKVAALQREQLFKAKQYQRQWQNYVKSRDSGKKVEAPDRDPNLDPLVQVLERRRTVHFHCHRADDIMTAVRLAEEFGFEIVLHHATEAYKVAEELAKRGIWVSLTLVDSPGGKPEVMALLEENASLLHKAGVKVAINTDDFITESRFLLRTGAIAVRGGLPEDAALKALTIRGAEMMHLENRLGSLEKGKDADFVVLSGRPFSVYTQVMETYIDGAKVFDRAQQRDWTYAVGGFALSRLERLPRVYPPAESQPEAKVPDMPAGAAPARDVSKRVAIYAGRIHRVSKSPITDGVILVEDGKIVQVGPRALFQLPPQTPVLTTAVVTPGLIDAHSVVGLTGAFGVKQDQDQDELSDPNQSDLRVLDGFNPKEPLLQFVREQGVTVAHVLPGRANVIAGQSGVFRTYGRTAEQMKLVFPAAVLVNLGESPKGTYPGRLPATRMGTANLVRTALYQAQNNARRRAAAKDDEKKPAPNLKSEALELALERKIPVYFSAHRADDIHTALRLSKEFNLKPVLSLATEGYLMHDTLREAKVPVVVHPTMQRPSGLETMHSHLNNAATLADHQVPLAICTAFEGYVPKTRVLRFEAAMAAVNGLGFDRALSAITLDAARLLGIEDRYGSLEPGKIADLVLYDGDPFEHATHVTHTLMDGRIVYDRAEYLKMPFERRALAAADGFGAVGCCME